MPLETKDWVVPIITALSTNLLLLVKDYTWGTSNTKRVELKELRNQQLKELYNRLFNIYIRHHRQLIVDIEEEKVGEDEFGEITIAKFVMENDTLWNELIDEVTELVHDKIHLLTYEDLQLWNDYLVESEKVPEHETDLYDRYQVFRLFVLKCAETYGTLYLEYQGITKKRKKERMRDIKERLKLLKNNPFYSERERVAEIKRLKQELKKMRK